MCNTVAWTIDFIAPNFMLVFSIIILIICILDFSQSKLQIDKE